MYLIHKIQAWFTDMYACCRLINNVNTMVTYKTVFYFHIERIFVVIKKKLMKSIKILVIFITITS